MGSERLNEMQDAEIGIDRALQHYLQLGYSESWINQRLKSNININGNFNNNFNNKSISI